MSPKVPDEYLEARRNQILEAAITCFAEKGFHRTTMQDIFDASGLSAGAVYNYFPSKDDIIAAMSETSRSRNAAMAAAAIEQDAADPVAPAFETIFELLRRPESAKWAAFDLELFSEASRNEAIAAGLRENVSAGLTAFVPLVERSQTSGTYPEGLDPRAIALVFVSLFYGMQILTVVDPSTDFDSYIDVCRSIIRGEFHRSEHSPRAEKGE